IARADELVVLDADFRNQARNVRRDFDDVGAHAAVARPGRLHVVAPQTVSRPYRQDDDYRNDKLMKVDFWHGTFPSRDQQAEQAGENDEQGETEKLLFGIRAIELLSCKNLVNEIDGDQRHDSPNQDGRQKNAVDVNFLDRRHAVSSSRLSPNIS